MRIVIAEDDALLREGLVLVLRGEGFEVAAAVGDPTAFAAAVTEHRPDIAVLDVRMPPSHTDEGIRAAVAARREHPDLAVLVLSAYVEQSFATDLLADGAKSVGYLLKERVGRVDTFVSALRRVAEGGTAIDPEVVAQLFARQRADDPLSRLSPREREVLAVMAEGLGNAAIAKRLFITDNAVHKHIRSIFAKLELAPTTRPTAGSRRSCATWTAPVPNRGVKSSSARPSRCASTAAWIRLRTPSLSVMTETWVLTVVTPRWSVLAISALEQPAPTRASTSRSRAVRWDTSAPVSVDCAETARSTTRRSTDGARVGSPEAARRTASIICCGSSSLTRKPMAPARSAA